MVKTNEELFELKQEYESLNTKLKELSESELKQIIGGGGNEAMLPPDAYGGTNRDKFNENMNVFNEHMKDMINNH